jgi:hypothetical protein
MSHWLCPAGQHVWDDRQPDAMEIDATTPDDVVEAFLFPGTCPLCGRCETRMVTADLAVALAVIDRAAPLLKKLARK